MFFLYICSMKILVCDNIKELGEDFVAWSMTVLPDWRKEQMLAIKHLRGRVQCAVSYLLLQHALQEIPSSVQNDKWVYNEHGKPYFADKNDVFFNISHCRSAVAVAIDDEEIGIDIEEIARYRESLVKYSLNDAEVETTSHQSDSAESFIELWTKKEAVFKFLGTGITHDIKDILKNNPDVNVYSQRIGDMILSVATYK